MAYSLDISSPTAMKVRRTISKIGDFFTNNSGLILIVGTFALVLATIVDFNQSGGLDRELIVFLVLNLPLFATNVYFIVSDRSKRRQ